MRNRDQRRPLPRARPRLRATLAHGTLPILLSWRVPWAPCLRLIGVTVIVGAAEPYDVRARFMDTGSQQRPMPLEDGYPCTPACLPTLLQLIVLVLGNQRECPCPELAYVAHGPVPVPLIGRWCNVVTSGGSAIS